jgi:hypothetical protein
MMIRRWALTALAVMGLHGMPALALTEAELRAAVPGDVPEDAILRTWSGMPDRTLVAWVDYESMTSEKVTSAPSSSGPELPDVIDLTVLVVQTSTGREMQRLHEDRIFDSLGVQFDHVEFDTANYALAPGRRAFGVRVLGRHLGFVAEDTATLLLLEPEGDALRHVLTLKTQWHLATRDCGEGHDLTRTIAIAPTSTQGRADLVVHERREDTPDGSAHPDNCHPKVRRSERMTTLRFDGTRYPAVAD